MPRTRHLQSGHHPARSSGRERAALAAQHRALVQDLHRQGSLVARADVESKPRSGGRVGERAAGDDRAESSSLTAAMHARDARAAGLLKWSVVGWLALVAVWLTWTPFELVGTPNTLRLVPDTTVTDVAGNLLLLVPFGAVVVLCGGRQPVMRATILAAMLSASLELGQIWIFGRVASVWDVALNTMGASIAAHLTLLLASRTRPPRVVAAIGAAVFVVVVA